MSFELKCKNIAEVLVNAKTRKIVSIESETPEFGQEKSLPIAGTDENNPVLPRFVTADPAPSAIRWSAE